MPTPRSCVCDAIARQAAVILKYDSVTGLLLCWGKKKGETWGLEGGRSGGWRAGRGDGIHVRVNGSQKLKEKILETTAVLTSNCATDL